MRSLLLSSAFSILPALALAQPQCIILPNDPAPLATDGSNVPVIRPDTALAQAVRNPPSAVTGAPALDHVVAAGAQLTEAGVSRSLRTVVAHSDGQFTRLYVAPGGRAVIAGMMADLSVAQLMAMAPGQVTELGTFHGLRGLFVRNGNQFQVYYATPDEEKVIPGVMWDAQGKSLTRSQVASIPGAVPTVMIGDTPGQASQGTHPPGLAPSTSLLKAVAGTTFGTIGSPSAPRLWLFVDPLCGYSVQAMEQLRPHVASGRVQLAVIPVAVLDREPQGGRSSAAAKAMLGLPPDAMIAAWAGNKLGEPAQPGTDRLLAGNMAAAAAIRLRGTPTFVWQKADGSEGRADGLPADVNAFIASLTR